jgi:DNA-binding PadR family transcriptional regulator
MPRWDPWDFPFGAMRGRRFEKGDIKYVILDLLKDRPSYGYEIIRALEERFGGFYSPSPGVVYPTLQMLEEMGYVVSSQEDGRKMYTITEEGRRFLNERAPFVDEVRSRMRGWHDHEMHESIHDAMREFGEMARVVGREARHMDPAKMKRVRDVLFRARREIEDILRERETPGSGEAGQKI